MPVSIKSYPGKSIKEFFLDHFLIPPQLTINSPGRINLIGEHTDYNNGFVLPAAINKAIQFSISKRNDGVIELFSVDKNQAFSTSINKLNISGLLWPDYITGVADELLKAGYTFTGFSAAITGNIPIGAGLSSSAALECATIYALNEIFGLHIDKVEMVKLAQKAENNFVGVQCGIMDQFASMMGKAGHAIRLDCRSLEYEYFPLNIDGYKIVLLDTQVKHSLALSEYNTRRNECTTGVNSIREKYSFVQSLRDATVEMIEETITDPVIKKRCLYVIQENLRLIAGCKNLANGDLHAFGEKMYASHEGLRDLYEVSCEELDFLVDLAKEHPEILGSRMMGGGFGGCTINIIPKDKVAVITDGIIKKYKEKYGIDAEMYAMQLSDGTYAITE